MIRIKENIAFFITSIIMIGLFLLDKNQFSYHVSVVTLLIALLSKNRLVNVSGVLTFILYILSDFSEYIYFDELYYSSVPMTISLFIATLLYSNYSFKEKEIIDVDFYISRIIDFLKSIILPFFVYLLGFVVIFFVQILKLEGLSDFLTLVNGILYLFLLNRNIKSVNEKQVNTKAEWLRTFVNNIYIPFSVVLMLIVGIEGIYFLFEPERLLSYEFQLGVFGILILNNIFVDTFITNEMKNKIINRFFYYLSIIFPFLLTILIVKTQSNNIYTLSNVNTLSGVYSLVFAILYTTWKTNKINKKLFFTLSTLIYLCPVIGLPTNPYQLSLINNTSIEKILTRKSYYEIREDIDDIDNIEYKTYYNGNYLEHHSISIPEENKMESYEDRIDDNLYFTIEGNKLYYTLDNEKIEVDYKNPAFESPVFITDKHVAWIAYVDTETEKEVTRITQVEIQYYNKK